MNTLYTITINRRKYVTTSIEEAFMFFDIFGSTIKADEQTTETIPNVIAV